MVDSTDFRIRGNENAASIIQSVGVERPTCRTKYGVRCETCEKGATRTDLALTSCDPSRSSRLLSRDYPAVGCSKRPSSAAAGETKPEAYPLGYVEDFVEPRTKLAAFFSSLLEDFSILT